MKNKIKNLNLTNIRPLIELEFFVVKTFMKI